MNATKRKFNALLQGLSSPRPSPPGGNKDDDMNATATPRYGSGSASNDEILQKRRRLGFPESTAPTLYSTLPVTTSLSNVVLRRPATAQPSLRGTSHAPAKYCPGDRDELLKRLATFQEITDWTPKPDRINEIEWAKRGWICQGKEKVRCVLCHKELVVKLHKVEDDCAKASVLASSEIAAALVEKYADLVISSHQQDCLWRKRGCDDTLLRLSFSNTQAALALLRQRYDELCSRSPFLPYEFNIRLPDNVSIDDVLLQLPPDFFTTPPPVVDKCGSAGTEKPPNRAALALALMGWQGLTNSRIGAVPNSASCHTCQRRLGLWMFKSKEVDEQGHIVVPAPMDHLDPVREHRYFCPWKDAQAQSRGGPNSNQNQQPPLTAWRTLLQAIKNESDLRNVYSGKSRRVDQLAGEESGSPSPSTRGMPVTPGSPAPATPTPKKSMQVFSAVLSPPEEPVTGEDDEKVRNAKDKERWARLRKVKSLFDTKGTRKFRLELGRPRTGHSSQSTMDK
ncbi:hypothetical protein E4U41_006505 [Claviceps citrina]|nr:hypothetical protein E4U41_006505 [Claviceps citrina]